MITYFRYVPHSQIVIYLARGWTIDDEMHGTSHGVWSVLMRYEGEGEPE